MEQLPDDIDAALWFPCSELSGGRDYLYAAAWHTFPGRMGAYCPHKKLSFRVSAKDIHDAPEATRYWVQGYLAGSLPRQPSPDLEGDELDQWTARAKAFFATGTWTDATG